MDGIFLLLGTNKGDKNSNLEVSMSLLQRKATLKTKSSLYETAAWGKTDQPSFLNQVIEVNTEQTPEELLEFILSIELEMGRIRKEKWGERLIDIDILYYGTKVVHIENLSIPHPEIQNRRFTLAPLVEICPTFVHPIFGKTQKQLLQACEDPLPVKRL